MLFRQGSNLVCTSLADRQGLFVGTVRFAVGVRCGGTPLEHAYAIAALWLALALLAIRKPGQAPERRVPVAVFG
jgi:hypothetical protein